MLIDRDRVAALMFISGSLLMVLGDIDRTVDSFLSWRSRRVRMTLLALRFGVRRRVWESDESLRNRACEAAPP